MGQAHIFFNVQGTCPQSRQALMSQTTHQREAASADVLGLLQALSFANEACDTVRP